MTMRKDFNFFKKTFLAVFAISVVLGVSSCNDKPKNEPKPEPTPVPAPDPNGGGTTGGGSNGEITMNISLANDTTIYLLPSEKYGFVYEISKGDVSVSESPNGWAVTKKEENGKKIIEVSTPEASSLGGNKKFDLVVGSVEKQDMPKVTVHFQAIDITERGGTFMLCEGGIKETGTMAYISPEGILIDTLYKRVNKSSIGNVAKDFFMNNGKGYILSENGVTDKGEDGMLVVVDLKTFKKISAFSNEELKDLKKPRYVASLDGNNIYIMDSQSLYHLDANSKSLTKIEDLTSTPSVPFVEQGGKLYYASEKKYFGASIKEITPGEKKVKEIQLPFRSHMELKKIVDVMPTNDGKLWLIGYYTKGTGLDMKQNYSVQKIDPTNVGTNKLPCNWIHKELSEIGDYHKVAIGSDNNIYYRDRMEVFRLTFDENAAPTIKKAENGTQLGFENTPTAISFVNYNKLLTNDRIQLRSGFAVNPVTNNIFAYTNEVYGMSIRTKKVVEIDGKTPSPAKPLRVWADVVGNYAAGFFFNK